MAKGGKLKDDGPNPSNVAHKDIIQRLNFLYQASCYLNQIDEPISLNHERVSVSDLSRNYIRTMKTVGKKTNVKIDPTVKRMLCKGCNTVLEPGSTATVRVRASPSHGHAVTYTCLSCKTSRRIPAPPVLPVAQTKDDPASKDEIMAVDVPSSTQHKTRRRKKKPPVPCPLPLFERPAGHVILCGNEKLTLEDS